MNQISKPYRGLSGRLPDGRLLESFPPAAADDLLQGVRSHFLKSGAKLVVVDDDPTGTQTVTGAQMIAGWEPADIEWLLTQPENIGFILTNSRAIDEAEAVDINRLIGNRLRDAAQRLDLPVTVVSRSDSTLRGHFPAEVDALQHGLGQNDVQGTMIVPFFQEGGRITVDGTHYVRDGERYIAAAETPFAEDRTFGYRASDLREWVEEKTHGATRAGDVGLVDIGLLRRGGVAAVAGYLRGLPIGSFCAVDAIDYQDLAVLVAAVQTVEHSGRRWMYRSAASLIPTLAGLSPAPPLIAPQIGADAGGLVVVGSHVPLSSHQLATLLDQPNVNGIEADAMRLASSDHAGAEIARLAAEISAAIGGGRCTVLYTSRQLVDPSSDPVQPDAVQPDAVQPDAVQPDAVLDVGRAIADGLVAVVGSLEVQPAYLVAKGGITSHTLAVDALGARRARVLGPIIAGVPMWEMGAATRFPGLPYVVFPGNVGDRGSLAAVVQKLEDGRT